MFKTDDNGIVVFGWMSLSSNQDGGSMFGVTKSPDLLLTRYLRFVFVVSSRSTNANNHPIANAFDSSILEETRRGNASRCHRMPHPRDFSVVNGL